MADIEIKITGADADEINQLLQLAGLPTKTLVSQPTLPQRPALPRFGFINSLPNPIDNGFTADPNDPIAQLPVATDDDVVDDSAFDLGAEPDLGEAAEHDCGEGRTQAVVGTGEVSPVRKPALRITNNFGDNPLAEDEDCDDEEDKDGIKKNVLIDRLGEEFSKWLSTQGITEEEEEEEVDESVNVQLQISEDDDFFEK